MAYRRLNLNKSLIKVAANPSPPMFYGKYNRTTNEYTPYYGFDISLLNALGDYFNFKWKIDHSFNKWGYKFPNNSWNGLIGKVASKRADIGLGALSINAERMEVVDFSIPNLVSRLTFVTLKPPRFLLKGVLLMPFQRTTWIMTIVTLISVLIVAKYIQIVVKTKQDIPWLAFSSFIQKGIRQKRLNSLAVHILIEFCWIMGLIMCAAYAGNIISFLTLNFQRDSIVTVRQLTQMIARNEVVPIVIKNSLHSKVFSENEESNSFKIISKNLQMVRSYRGGYHRLIYPTIQDKRYFALIGPYNILDTYARMYGRQHFRLRDRTESAILTDLFGVALHKNSNWTQYFDRFIRMALEGGLFYFWHKNVTRMTPKVNNVTNMIKYDTRSDKCIFDVLELKHIDSQIFFLLYGIAVSSIILILELNLFLVVHYFKFRTYLKFIRFRDLESAQ